MYRLTQYITCICSIHVHVYTVTHSVINPIYIHVHVQANPIHHVYTVYTCIYMYSYPLSN